MSEPKPPVQGLLEELKDENAEVRRAAVVTLGELNDSSALNPLVDALRNDDNEDVRVAASEALLKLGDAIALGALESWSAVCRHGGECGRPTRYVLRIPVVDDPFKIWRVRPLMAVCSEHVNWYASHGWRAFLGPVFVKWETDLAAVLAQVPHRARAEMLRLLPLQPEEFDQQTERWKSNPETQALAVMLQELGSGRFVAPTLPMYTLHELLAGEPR